MEGLKSFFKRNPLIVSMLAGVFIYLTYHWIPALHPAGPALEKAVLTIQPILIFLMLFLQFSRTSPHDLKFRRWHLYLLLIQTGVCLASAAALFFVKDDVARVLLEAFMLCWICPTAIAAGVVTEKIGGSISGVMSYIILNNLLVSILIPLVFPMVHPHPDQSFVSSCLTLLGKVFPTLIMPAEKFESDIATIWIEQVRSQEIAELLVMNLLQYVNYASDMAFQLLAEQTTLPRLIGFNILSRLFSRNMSPNERDINEFIDQAITDLKDESLSLRHAALNSVQRFATLGEMYETIARGALKPLEMDYLV